MNETRTRQAEQLTDRYLALWNEPDADRRRRIIAELWTADGSQILQPPQEMREIAASPGIGLTATLEARGHAELEARAATSYDHWVGSEGLSFRGRDDVDRLGDVVKFHWEAVSPDGEVAAVGLVFVVLGADGRIRRDYVFIESGVMTTIQANGVTLGVEHFGDAAAPLVLLAGGTDHALLARRALRGARTRRAPCRAVRPARLRRLDHRRSQRSGLHAARSRRRRRGARPRARRPAGAPGGHRRQRDGRPGRRPRPPGRVLGAHPRRNATGRSRPGRQGPARPRQGDDEAAVLALDARLVRPRRRRGVRRRPRGDPRR